MGKKFKSISAVFMAICMVVTMSSTSLFMVVADAIEKSKVEQAQDVDDSTQEATKETQEESSSLGWYDSQKDTFTIYDLLDATHMGDAFAISMLEDWGRYLGCGIASILPLFSPDIIIISDIMIGGGQCLLEAIEHSMHFYQHCCYRSPKLIFADPQDDLVLLGAATVAIDKVLSDPNRYFPSGSEP